MRFKFLLAAAIAVRLAGAAILPDTIGSWKRGEPGPAVTPDQKVWREYGLQDAETSPYADGDRKFAISAWRFADATGAMAAFEDLRPVDAKPAPLMGLAAQNDAGQIVAAGNYLFLFKGYNIKPEELSHVVATVPKYEHSPLPTLPKYLPVGFVPNSERYIVGPASLLRYAPGIPPSTVGFHFNAEGALASYGSKGKETTLVVFNYPTMEMARDRYAAFQKTANTVSKRSGPLVAVVLNPASPDEAERLLSGVRYQATVTVPEAPLPNRHDNAGTLMLNIFLLCLILAAFCILSGIVVGGIRVLFQRAGASGEGDNMISLHLSGRP
ncbi:MAG TPA: DUF6599 family protein [Bryobacteraceae bacterium]|nr:DUF6599 family protein [Bryobacteraceae bacterium]